MTTSRIFFDGKTNKMRTAFIIECNDTEDYIAKEEVENGTWYYDRMGSGASVAWFVPKKEVAQHKKLSHKKIKKLLTNRLKRDRINTETKR